MALRDTSQRDWATKVQTTGRFTDLSGGLHDLSCYLCRRLLYWRRGSSDFTRRTLMFHQLSFWILNQEDNCCDGALIVVLSFWSVKENPPWNTELWLLFGCVFFLAKHKADTVIFEISSLSLQKNSFSAGSTFALIKFCVDRDINNIFATCQIHQFATIPRPCNCFFLVS